MKESVGQAIKQTQKCQHFWIFGDSLDGMATGRCKKCGLEQKFYSGFDAARAIVWQKGRRV